MKFYTYWRSTAAYRVRIGLKLKGIQVTDYSIHLTRDGGDQFKTDYATINPTSLVPALELDDGRVLIQSLAILDYLEETFPSPALLPAEPFERAQVRAAAQIIACDIHPINNLRIGQYLKSDHGQTQDDVVRWMCHWMDLGLASFEKVILPDTKFCFGDAPGLADICLVAQLYNAHRWGAAVDKVPRLLQIEKNCLEVPAFAESVPEVQPDSESV